MDGEITLTDELARFSEHWSPHIVGSLNDYELVVEAHMRLTEPQRTVNTGD